MISHVPTCQVKGPRSGKRSQYRLPPARRAEMPALETEFRAELVARVRREIAEGTYDTPEKFDIALERLLERLENE